MSTKASIALSITYMYTMPWNIIIVANTICAAYTHAGHNGMVRCNIVEYTLAFLYSMAWYKCGYVALFPFQQLKENRIVAICKKILIT